MGGQPERAVLRHQGSVEFDPPAGLGRAICLGKMGQTGLKTFNEWKIVYFLPNSLCQKLKSVNEQDLAQIYFLSFLILNIMMFKIDSIRKEYSGIMIKGHTR